MWAADHIAPGWSEDLKEPVDIGFGVLKGHSKGVTTDCRLLAPVTSNLALPEAVFFQPAKAILSISGALAALFTPRLRGQVCWTAKGN